MIAVDTDRLLLRTLDASAAELVLDFRLRNRLFFRPWTATRHEGFFTIEAERQQLGAEAQELASGHRIKLWLSPRAEERIIGYADFSAIIRGPFQSCYLGYALDENENGKGYMSEALREAIRYVFDEVGLHRIEANIMPRNTRSLRVAERLGFHREGLARRYLRINGVWEDHIHMVLINE